MTPPSDHSASVTNTPTTTTSVATSATTSVATTDPDSDIFGPARDHSDQSHQLHRSHRPKVSMISAELRAKEERRRVIRLCGEKLERIKDPDANLRRSVCINNTYYRLQAEVRREKQGKHLQQLHQLHNSERSATPLPPLTSITQSLTQSSDSNNCCDLERIDRELSALADSLGNHDEGAIHLGEDIAVRPSEEVLRSYEGQVVMSARKRACEEVDDKLVQEVLSHFYSQQPASKLLTAIEDEPETKRSRQEDTPTVDNPTINTNVKTDFEIILDALRLGNGTSNNEEVSINNQFNNQLENQINLNDGKRLDSCGQAAIFADLNGAAFHSLMASLET